MTCHGLNSLCLNFRAMCSSFGSLPAILTGMSTVSMETSLRMRIGKFCWHSTEQRNFSAEIKPVKPHNIYQSQIIGKYNLESELLRTFFSDLRCWTQSLLKVGGQGLEVLIIDFHTPSQLLLLRNRWN